MDRREAAAIADAVVGELEAIPFQALVDRFLGEIEVRVETGASGVEYQVEIQAMWDRRGPGDLRVMVGVDDGSLRGAFRPVSRDFLVAAEA
jgi:hypothetical protein